jgi:hypothetical protein
VIPALASGLRAVASAGLEERTTQMDSDFPKWAATHVVVVGARRVEVQAGAVWPVGDDDIPTQDLNTPAEWYECDRLPEWTRIERDGAQVLCQHGTPVLEAVLLPL